MNNKIKEWIENKIDHYTPYRPILETQESIEVKKVLSELLNFMETKK